MYSQQWMNYLMNFVIHFTSSFLHEPQKSVEEERKERGDKVSTLLNWMSEVKSDVNKNESVGDDRGSTESSNKPQVKNISLDVCSKFFSFFQIFFTVLPSSMSLRSLVCYVCVLH